VPFNPCARDDGQCQRLHGVGRRGGVRHRQNITRSWLTEASQNLNDIVGPLLRTPLVRKCLRTQLGGRNRRIPRRARLHIAASTVRRMLNRKPAAERRPAPLAIRRESDQPPIFGQAEHRDRELPKPRLGLDTTAVPTSAGFWTTWLPFSFAQSCPSAGGLPSSSTTGPAALSALLFFKRRPTVDEICLVLDEAARRAGRAPKYTVSDQGTEFGENYLEWCDDHDVRARFGAVGRHGSICRRERLIRNPPKKKHLAHEWMPLQHSKT